MRRVVVTGLGLVAPTGNNVKDGWDSAVHGRSGIGKITVFDAPQVPIQIAGEVRGFDPTLAMDAKEANRSSRFVQFAAGAAKEALDDSQLMTHANPERVGCAIGVGLGAIDWIEEYSYVLRDKGPRRVSPFFLPYTLPNMAAGVVSLTFNLKGPNIAPATACTSGTHGIGEAYMYIQRGMADAMVAGGSESAISPLAVSAFAIMRTLSQRSDDPTKASRPFDKDRDGFVIGEGCGLLVLEEYEHAKKRGAHIYAELVGYGMSADANHITAPAPEGEGAQRCMRMALATAEINPEAIGYINAHGTSTKLNDAYESAAIGHVFGDHAKRLAVSSTKAVTGHCLGAAGGIEAVYSVLALARGVIPPTVNWETRDPECPLDYVPGAAREAKLSYVMSNSFGFGGTNGTVIFKHI